MGKGDDMSEGVDLATRIAQATGIQPEKLREAVQLALEELHRVTIVDEKGPTAAVMEACFFVRWRGCLSLDRPLRIRARLSWPR
jgi:hypothetical protein